MAFRDFVKKTLPIIVLAVIMGGTAYWLYEGVNKLNVALTVILIAIATGELIQRHWPKRSKVVLMEDHDDRGGFNGSDSDPVFALRFVAVNKGDWKATMKRKYGIEHYAFDRAIFGRPIPFISNKKDIGNTVDSDNVRTSLKHDKEVELKKHGKSEEGNVSIRSRIMMD